MEGEKKISRRNFLKTLAGGAMAAIAGSKTEAAISESPEITEDKNRAVERYMSKLEAPGNEAALMHVRQNAFWGKKEPGAMTGAQLRSHLRSESQMEVIDAKDISTLKSKFASQISDLVAKIKPEKTGLFLDGDSQTLYVIKRERDGSLSFLKAYPVVTSKHDWSDKKETRGTPTGFKAVELIRYGFLGEDVSTTHKHAEDTEHFINIPVVDESVHREKKTRIATFVRGMTKETQPIPEVISTAILIDGERGIWIHGSPRANLAGLDPEHRRDKAGSTGCVRTSNVDVLDLTRYVEAGTPIYIYGKNPEREPDVDWFGPWKK